MKVPLLDLSSHGQGELSEKLLKSITEVLSTQKFILGPQVQELEKRIADYCGSKFAVGVSSGTDALIIALMALDISPDDEVITTPFTFFATAGAIARVGAKPVFVDIDRETFNLNISQIEKVITRRTKTLLPVHLYGQCAEMDPLIGIAKKHGIPIIEDAAQAIGAEYKNGKRAGSMGIMGCFSFFPSKNLGAIGDAGLVTTDDPALAEKLVILRTHGSKPKYFHKLIGGNFRIDTIQAAVLDVKLSYLDDWTRQRQNNANNYEVLFRSGSLLEKGLIKLPAAVYKESGVRHFHIYNQFVIRAQKRDQLKEFLQKNQIGTEIYYPVPLHLQECFKNLGYKPGDFPESEAASRETLALPIYPEVTLEMQAYVVEKIMEFYKKQ